MPRSLVVTRPCPIPARVTGDDCAHCGKRVHDLRRSSDPAADLERLGGRACVRILVSALVLGGCSAADLQAPVQITPTASADAGAEAAAPTPPDDVFVGETAIAE